MPVGPKPTPLISLAIAWISISQTSGSIKTLRTNHSTWEVTKKMTLGLRHAWKCQRMVY